MYEKEKIYERDFWLKVKKARGYRVDLERIVKEDKVREESTRKIIKAYQIGLDNKELLEGACEMYKRYRLIRMTADFILNYYISTFKKYMTE